MTMLMSVRVEDMLGQETDQAAEISGMSRSDYLRTALEAQNQRVLNERMQYLSQQLSADHLAENSTLEATNMDGLHEG